MSGNQPNIFQCDLPNRIVIGMVDADAFNGTFFFLLLLLFILPNKKFT
jgi:hypothetical protein